jgi:hypothetical protein
MRRAIRNLMSTTEALLVVKKASSEDVVGASPKFFRGKLQVRHDPC